MLNNTDKLSTNLIEILRIKKELGEKSKDSIAWIWEEGNKLKRLLEIIEESKSELKQANQIIINRLCIHIRIFLGHKDKIKNIDRWFRILNLYLEKYISIIKMTQQLEKVIGNVLEYDTNTLVELNPQNHPYETAINQALYKVGEVIGDNSFSTIAPLVILVRKEKLGSWGQEGERIKARIREHFRELDTEDFINFSHGVYRVKTQPELLGISVNDDRVDSIHAIVSVPDKATIIHETEHFIKKLFYDVPSAEVGGIVSLFLNETEIAKTHSLFSTEFLAYLLQYGNTNMYKNHLHAKERTYPFIYPNNLDTEYESRLDEFANQVMRFIHKHPDGLLLLTALYPVYRRDLSHSPDGWKTFDVPANPIEDISLFEQTLIRWGYNPKIGVTRNSTIGEFLQEHFKKQAATWLQVYKTQLK